MASGINFSGLGSGIDFGSITDSIISQESRPLRQLQSRQSLFKQRADALKELNSKLIALTEATRALNDTTLGSDRAASSTNQSVLTATATNGATAGSINVSVTRPATSFTEASRSFASTGDPVLSSGTSSATFELRVGGAGSGTSITIDSSNNSLAGLRNSINAANAGVTATIVDVNGDGASYQLVLRSNDTGARNRVELAETSGTGSDANVNLRSLNPPAGVVDSSTLDASLSINGLPITRASNTITDAVSGVTLNLSQTGTTTVNIAADTTAVTDKVKAFVDSYNSVRDFVSAQYAPDATGKPGGVLVGDSTLREVQRSLRDALNSSSSGTVGAFTNLTQIGIGRDTSGKLTLDSAVLNDRLTNSLTDVRALLTGTNGLANSIAGQYSNLSDQISGVVQTAINGYKSSAAALDKTIAAQQDRLDTLRVSLQRRFAAADAAIGQLNGQGTTLGNVIKSLEPRN